MSPPVTAQLPMSRGYSTFYRAKDSSPASYPERQADVINFHNSSPSSDDVSNYILGIITSPPGRIGTLSREPFTSGPSSSDSIGVVSSLGGCSPSFDQNTDCLMLQLHQILIDGLAQRVSGVFIRKQAELGALSVFVVVDRHTDDVYDLITEVEERVFREVGALDVCFEVRARKGRTVTSMVPSDAYLVE